MANKVPVRFRNGKIRTMSEKHARVLVLLKKAEIVTDTPSVPVEKPTPQVRTKALQAEGEVSEKPKRQYRRRDLRAEE